MSRPVQTRGWKDPLNIVGMEVPDEQGMAGLLVLGTTVSGRYVVMDIDWSDGMVMSGRKKMDAEEITRQYRVEHAQDNRYGCDQPIGESW